MSLQGKKVLVTGASSGLGFSIAKLMLEKGAFVYLLGHDQLHLETAAKNLGSKNYELIVADVADFNNLNLALSGKQIDILINNAGIWLEDRLENNSIDQINACLDTNLKGPILVTKSVLPQMQKRNSGFILNISSTSGLSGKESQAVYSASKYGVRGFTDSLKLDLAKTNIKVMGFYPGGMNTPMFAKAGSTRQVRNWMDTDKVARVIIFMLEQDETMMIGNLELNRRTL